MARGAIARLAAAYVMLCLRREAAVMVVATIAYSTYNWIFLILDICELTTDQHIWHASQLPTDRQNMHVVVRLIG